VESSAHAAFKAAIVGAGPSDTKLMMKNLVPVRLLKNQFFTEVEALEAKCAGTKELETLLGKGRAKAGMLDGDLDQGELEIGQVSAMIKDIPSVRELIQRLEFEYSQALKKLNH
jgi:enoyl-[acyl-carrier protein] reductase II